MEQTIEDQLYDAVSRNDINNVKRNLRKGSTIILSWKKYVGFCLFVDVNINTICSSGLTPLGAAAHLGNITICETLIENYKRTIKDDDFSNHRNKKLCIDFSNERQRTNDHKNVGYFVVKKDLDATDDEIGDGPTPEGMDALEWDTEIKETDECPTTDSYSCLYKWYADILNRTSDLLKTPLHCDINQIDRYGRTALHYASDRGHTSIVQLLLTAGCNANHTSSDNVSPLHLASSQGHCDIVKLLVQAGARVNHITNSKTTPLHFASSQGHIKIMHVLLQAGANVDALDACDRTPLVRAASQQQSKAVEVLVRHGARVNIEDANGYTPLCEAVWVNSLPIVQTLISAGAKVTQSHFLLHYSVLNNQLDITRLLVSAGSVINLRDDNGNTPLILAAKNGQVDTAKFLIDHGKYFCCGNQNGMQ